MTTQPTLFDEQEQNLRRVGAQIAPAILSFCRDLWASGGREFHMQELHGFVRSQHPGTAPASADRILRQLRAAGRVLYRVKRRRASLYELIRVAPEANP